SVRDSDRMVGLLASKSKRAEEGENPIKQHLLVTRYDTDRVKRGEMLKVDDVLEMLALPLLGVIPESKSVLQASNTGTPVILDEKAAAGSAYRDSVGRFLGEQIEYRFASEKKGLMSRFGFNRLWRRDA
ncbi:MAG: septum site-determining protein MinD, partial [Geminicoccaceae bacterium]